MDRQASRAAIRRAYRAKARRLHPDRPGGDARAMQALNEAWWVLGDDRRRRAYDCSLEAQGAAAGPGPEATGATASGQAEAPGLPGRGDPVVLVPAALVATALLVGALGVVFASPGALAAAAVLGFLGGWAFALAPIVALRRDRRRRG